MTHMRITALLALIFCAIQLNAQNFSHKEKYDDDFRFTDGIYLNKDDLKNNRPIEKAQISTNLDPDDLTYFEQLMQNKKISIFDNLGNEQEIEVSKIFGFCNYGNIYINCNGNFCRLGIVGNICHFLGYKTVYRTQPSPYLGMYGYSPYYYSNNYRQTSTSEAQQYLYSFETGQILEFNSSNMELLLMNDANIQSEFSELSRKKKNAKLIYYMRLYNEKHPLYIPVYE